MKKIIALVFLGMFVCICCANKIKKESTSNYEKWNDNVIMPYAEAFNDMAKVSPIIGGDTETDWAVSQVDSIYHLLMSDTISIPKKLANIDKMQSYVAYGITYFLSIVGYYTEPDVANSARYICYNTDSIYNVLNRNDFNNSKDLSLSSLISLLNYSHYYTLYNAFVGENVFNDEGHLASIRNIIVESNLLYNSIDNQEQAYRLSSIIEQSAFFMTMCPLIQSLQSKEQYHQTHDSIISYAYWFDAHTQPIEIKIRDNKIDDIQPISDEEFYHFMVAATKRKVAMLKMLKQAIESRKKIN